MNVPNEAVEAAQSAMMIRDGERFDVIARAALEAAAPHMMEAAWDEGEAAGQDNADSNRGYNIQHKYNPYKKDEATK